MSRAVCVPCDDCDDPVTLGPNGWGRCRACGWESLRDSLSHDVAAVLSLGASGAREARDAGLVSLFDKSKAL